MKKLTLIEVMVIAVILLTIVIGFSVGEALLSHPEYLDILIKLTAKRQLI